MVIYTIYHISYICAITNLIFSFGAGFIKNLNSHSKYINRVWVSHPTVMLSMQSGTTCSQGLRSVCIDRMTRKI